MNEDLKQIAALALRNAFWRDFSILANTYLDAAAGLDDEQEMQMGDLTSIYGRDDEAKGALTLNIWTQHQGYTVGHQTMMEALEKDGALEIHLEGLKVFERRDGEWYFTDPKPVTDAPKLG